MMKNPIEEKPIAKANVLDSVLEFLEGHRHKLLAVTIGLLGAAGVLLFLWGTFPNGIGIRTDSVAYLWSAESLARGIGLGTLDAFGKFKPLIHFPPLYPILLAVFEAFNIDGMTGAVWLVLH